MNMKISVVGCGRWGSLITWYLAEKKGLDVTLYGREDSKHIQRFIKERRNDLLTLPESVKISTSLSCLSDADVIIISINSQGLADFMREIKHLELKNKVFVLCMKGIDIESGRRLSPVQYKSQSPYFVRKLCLPNRSKSWSYPFRQRQQLNSP